MATPARTLYDKLCDHHKVADIDADRILLYVDFHLMNEYTSPQAFAGLRSAGRSVWAPHAHLAVVDHVNPTRAVGSIDEIEDEGARLQIRTLGENCRRYGIELFDLFDPRQGIEHVVAPENGFIQPGMVVACGDSHTTTYGALGALGFGIGTSEIEHVLATQTLVYQRLKPMRVTIDGALAPGVASKDIVMAVIAEIGAAGAVGYAVEFAGSAIEALSVEARMTICNMAVEAGARAALIAPDEKVFAYLEGRPRAPEGAELAAALEEWRGLRSDPDAVFARELRLAAEEIPPLVSWGTSPDQSVSILGAIPDPAEEPNPARRAAMERALAYMDLTPGVRMRDIEIDFAFIGSCTNSRIDDLRAAARIVEGRRVAPGVSAIVVPGSKAVRETAMAEGLDRVFVEAGFEWRGSGCSMCLAMNDDILLPGARAASSTNRNFEGRQGRGARTHLMSPAMVAAAAVSGRLTDVRRLGEVRSERGER